mmetsp:Transcript_18916/g.60465  ORF Transcript_18916/g.60465 Transcript_18916/m.60465 type:complete len:667 (+) Transcript_18916:48-2048(+)
MRAGPRPAPAYDSAESDAEDDDLSVALSLRRDNSSQAAPHLGQGASLTSNPRVAAERSECTEEDDDEFLDEVHSAFNTDEEDDLVGHSVLTVDTAEEDDLSVAQVTSQVSAVSKRKPRSTKSDLRVGDGLSPSWRAGRDARFEPVEQLSPGVVEQMASDCATDILRCSVAGLLRASPRGLQASTQLVGEPSCEALLSPTNGVLTDNSSEADEDDEDSVFSTDNSSEADEDDSFAPTARLSTEEKVGSREDLASTESRPPKANPPAAPLENDAYEDDEFLDSGVDTECDENEGDPVNAKNHNEAAFAAGAKRYEEAYGLKPSAAPAGSGASRLNHRLYPVGRYSLSANAPANSKPDGSGSGVGTGVGGVGGAHGNGSGSGNCGGGKDPAPGPQKARPAPAMASSDSARPQREHPGKEPQRPASHHTAGPRRKPIRPSRRFQDGKSSFLERMDETALRRRKQREDERAKLDYEESQRKKICPECGITQSFDQVRKRQKKCLDCGVLFKLPLVWNDVKAKFMARNEQTDLQNAAVEPQTAASPRPSRRRHYAPVSRAFLERMDLAAERRRERIRRANAMRPSSASVGEARPSRGAGWSGGDPRLNYTLFHSGHASVLPIEPEQVLKGKLPKPALCVNSARRDGVAAWPADDPAQLWQARSIVRKHLFPQ